MTLESVRIGMCQLLVEGGEPERNIERAAKMVEEASAKGCQIALLPETFDLAWTHPSVKTEAQPIPGPNSDRLCDLARRNRIFICAGLTEREGDMVFNAAVLIDDVGKIILKYHKINLLQVCLDYYAPGQSLSVVDTPFGKIGVNICADNFGDSLEIGHVLARMGAQIILSPSSWTVDYHITEKDDPYGAKWFKPYHTLASLYDMVIVSATSVGVIVGGPYEGKKSIGCSLAVGKDGVLAQGRYNEFASDLVLADVKIPKPHPIGTALGEMLRKKGYYAETYAGGESPPR